MDTFKKLLMIHNIATQPDGDYLLGSFSNYYNVTISIEATGLNQPTCSVDFLERVDASAAWKIPTGLSYILPSPTSSQELTYGDAGSDQVGIRIAKNTATTGVLRIWIIARAD